MSKGFALSLLVVMVLLGHFALEWHRASSSPEAVRQLPPPPLPAIGVRLNDQVMTAILAHDLLDPARGVVEKLSQGSKGQKNPPDLHHWRLVAVALQQVDAPVAVIADGTKLTSLREGESLPDGSSLVQVMADGIVVEVAGKNEYIYLFGKKN